jgi:hypothetical protein
MNTITDALSTADRWTILVAFLLPNAIALINQTHWAPALKAVVSFACCIVTAIVDVIVQGNFNGKDMAGTLILVAFVAYTSYRLFWKPSTIAPQIEAATSTGSPRVVTQA